MSCGVLLAARCSLSLSLSLLVRVVRDPLRAVHRRGAAAALKAAPGARPRMRSAAGSIRTAVQQRPVIRGAPAADGCPRARGGRRGRREDRGGRRRKRENEGGQAPTGTHTHAQAHAPPLPFHPRTLTHTRAHLGPVECAHPPHPRLQLRPAHAQQSHAAGCPPTLSSPGNKRAGTHARRYTQAYAHARTPSVGSCLACLQVGVRGRTHAVHLRAKLKKGN